MNEIIMKAMNYAFEKHKNHRRKGTQIPYFVHLMDTASILIKECRVSDEIIAAGFLHDVVEDNDKTGVSEEMLRLEFGDLITDFLMEVTQKKVPGKSDKESWRERKEEAIEHLKNTSKGIQMLKCADRLANIRDIITDCNRDGEEVWARFNSSKEDQMWYNQNVLENLSGINDTDVYWEYAKAVREVFGE